VEAQVREILSRVLVDDDVLDEMRRDPHQALREYDLTDDERSVLTSSERDLIALMRIAGEGSGFTFLYLVIMIELDLTEFITTIHLDIVIEQTREAQRQQELRQDKIDALARSVLSMRSGADRLERIHEMLQVVSGATELARQPPSDQPEEGS
jgi:hypothetical protein